MLRPSITFRVNNATVGVIGYVSSANAFFLPTNASIRFEDETVAIKRESQSLKRKGANVIIALGYAGFSTDKRIAETVEEVDVVIGGLTNNFLWNGPQPNAELIEGGYPAVVVQKSGKKVPVAQTYGFSKYVGKLRLRFNDSYNLVNWRGNPMFLRKDIQTDDVVVRVLDSYRASLRFIAEEDVVLGQSIVPLSAESAYNSESNLANFVTDSILEFAIANRHVRPNSFALINAGAFKGTIPTSRSEPNITRKVG